MTPIEDLFAELQPLLPEAELRLIKPLHPEGFWFLDVNCDGQLAAAIWTDRTGLLVSRKAQKGPPASEAAGTEWIHVASYLHAAIFVLCALLRAQCGTEL